MPVVGDRFDRKWTPEPNTGCHLWLGWVNWAGYGGFNNGVRNVLAHRWSFERAFGALPAARRADGSRGRRLVLHRCDQPSCVNPAHLWLGTQADNLRDMVAKHRSLKGRTSGWHPNLEQLDRKSKISAGEIQQMRDLWRWGWSQMEIASMYEVASSSVSRCLNGRKGHFAKGRIATLKDG